jgi:hypothetical protein
LTLRPEGREMNFFFFSFFFFFCHWLRFPHSFLTIHFCCIRSPYTNSLWDSGVFFVVVNLG